MSPSPEPSATSQVDAPASQAVAVAPSRRGRVGLLVVVLAAGAVSVACYLDMRTHPTQQAVRTTHHLAAAQSLLAGQGFKNVRNRDYTQTPPAYPILLAALHLAGLSWWASVCLINAILLGASVLATHSLCRSLGVRGGTAVLLLNVVLFPHLDLVRQARPDWMFTVCCLVAIAWTVAYLRRPRWTLLLGLSVAGALAAGARYMALFTLFPTIVASLLLVRGDALRRRLRDVMIFVCIAGIPIGAWLARNVAGGRPISGMERTHLRASQDPSMSTFSANARFIPTVFFIDLFCWPTLATRPAVSGEQPLEYQGVSLGIVSLALAALIGWAIVHRSGLRSFWCGAAGVPAPERDAVLVVAGYFAMYQLALMALWTYGNNDQIHTRFVTPSYAFLLILLGATCTAISRRTASRAARRVLQVCVVGALIFHVSKSAANWNVSEPQRNVTAWLDAPDFSRDRTSAEPPKTQKNKRSTRKRGRNSGRPR